MMNRPRASPFNLGNALLQLFDVLAWCREEQLDPRTSPSVELAGQALAESLPLMVEAREKAKAKLEQGRIPPEEP
jgi:hypothetical protein